MQQVYAFVAGRLPDKVKHPFLRKHCERLLNETPGLIDWVEMKENGTLLFFGTRTHAEKAMSAMRRSRNPVDDDIFTVDADYDTHTFRVRIPMESDES